MPREPQPEPDLTGDIPIWFVTYSDAITLLMTFFILLLTFSSSEPEKFQRMQATAFSGGGSSGFASEIKDPQEKDALVVRERPMAGRLTMRGSETPPGHTDPSGQSLARGLKSFEDAADRDPLDSHLIHGDLNLFVDETDEITGVGSQRLRMLAIQMHRFPVDIDWQVNTEQDALKAFKITEYLNKQEQITLGRMSISIAPPGASIPKSTLRIEVRRAVPY